MNTKDNKLIYESYYKPLAPNSLHPDGYDKDTKSSDANRWVEEYKANLGGLYNYLEGERRDNIEAPHELPGSQILDTIDKAETLIRELFATHLEQWVSNKLPNQVDYTGTITQYRMYHGSIPLYNNSRKDERVWEWEGLMRLYVNHEPEWWHPDDTLEDRQPGSWEEGDGDEVNFANLPEIWISLDRRKTVDGDSMDLIGPDRLINLHTLITHDNQDRVLKEIKDAFSVYENEIKGTDDLSDWDF
jgi:hypothetical protein